jgi:hypothetical protein
MHTQTKGKVMNAWKHLTDYGTDRDGNKIDVYERIYTPAEQRGVVPTVSAHICRAEGQIWWRVYVPGYDRFGVTQVNVARGVVADVPGAVAVAKAAATRAGNKAVVWERELAEANALKALDEAIAAAERSQAHLKESQRRRIAWDLDVAKGRAERLMALAA